MLEITKIAVKLAGLAPIMFDRFIDHSREARPAEQRLYLVDGNVLVMPQENIEAFMFGMDPKGCAMTFEGKRCKEYRTVGMSHVFIEETSIPFQAEGKDIIFDGFNDRIWIHNRSGGRTGSGSSRTKQEPKQRPVLNTPWSLSFTLTVVKNALIDETKLYNWFTSGGVQIALGTYRPRWGRVAVEKWEVE